MATETRESTHRWNVEETEAGVRICRGVHEKAAPCEWEEYVLAAEPPVVVPSERERQLEEALRPFATYCLREEAKGGLEAPDDIPVLRTGTPLRVTLTIGDFRRAARALTSEYAVGSPDKQGGK